MELCFENAEICDECNSEKALRKRWGAVRAERLAQRLQEIHALEALDDLASLPHVNVSCQKASIVVSVDEGLSLILRPLPSIGSFEGYDGSEGLILREIRVDGEAIGCE